MTQRIFALLLIGIATVWTVAAQPAALAPTAEDKALLWEISGKDLSAPSYLFGTIHMINKEDFFLTESLQESFQKTESVAFEINMEEMTDFATLMPLMMRAFMPDGVTLADLLTDEEYLSVKAHFEKMGLPIIFLERIKPMFLSALGSGEGFSLDGENGNVVSYEMELMRMAKEQEKPISGLETAEFQMSMFDSIPYEVQARMLVESIQAGDTGDDQFRTLVDLYKAQDLYGLQEMLESDPEGLGKYTHLLLEKRNRNWIPVMAERMAKGSTFFAVGAGHLGGATGVIALLREQGYTVLPLRDQD